MIERRFIKEKIQDFRIQQYLLKQFSRSSYSHTIIQKTPLGEKIIVFSSKPGLIVGRGGSNIKTVIKTLKEDFGMQSPQVEVQEVNVPDLDPSIVSERIADMLTRMGTARFKYIGHSMTQRIIDSGAIGAEIQISGKVPSKRAKTWKFNLGYLPKTGYPADEYVKKGYRIAKLKTGIIGVTVKILPPGTVMPDEIMIIGEVKVKESPINKEIKEKIEKKAVEKKEEKPAKKAVEKKEEKPAKKEEKK